MQRPCSGTSAHKHDEDKTDDHIHDAAYGDSIDDVAQVVHEDAPDEKMIHEPGDAVDVLVPNTRALHELLEIDGGDVQENDQQTHNEEEEETNPSQQTE